MKWILSSTSKNIVESFTFTRTLYAFDFDGTLSKIVPRPENAKMSDTTQELLQRLAKYAPVAVISGRSLSDLTSKVTFSPVFLIGNHGLEGTSGKTISLDRAKKASFSWKSQLKALDVPEDIEIEDKVFSLSIHYRRSRSRKEAKAKIETAIAHLHPKPRVMGGKCVFNLLPKDSPHKGIAVLDLVESLGVSRALYVGDDDTDEDVFLLRDSRVIGVRVGQKRNSGAKFYLPRQGDINHLLTFILQSYQSNVEPAKSYESI